MRYNILAFFIIFVVLLTSCRKELCYDHDKHSYGIKVEILPRWELEWERAYGKDWKQDWQESWGFEYRKLKPKPSKGIRSKAYQNESILETNIPREGGRIHINEGISDILLYSNDTEYIVFNGLEATAKASATTRTLTRVGFEGMHSEERTMNQPDMLYGSYIEDYQTSETMEPVILKTMMKPLVYTYYIRYEFEAGLEHMELARGALAGMAENVYLKDGHTGNSFATIMFDCDLTEFGAETKVKTFGVPNYPGDHYTKADGTPAEFTLNLEVMMTNGKRKTFNIDVTNQVVQQPRGGVIVVDGLVITEEDAKPDTGGGAFDSTVEGWGDFIDIPLPI